MAKRKSRFPSYGLVRGASHAQGGVAGMVAGEQPVELEGGEWIIPKEAVPDYLPVLKQITNEGRAMQQMDNGNTAIDALMASASMETGLAQPKSPMYQTGGQVEPSIMDYLSQLQGVQQKYQGDVMTGAGASKYSPEGMLTKEGLSELYDFPLEQMTLDTLMAGPRTRKITIKGPEREAEHIQTLFGMSDKKGDEFLEKSGITGQLKSAYPTESSRLGYLMDDAGKAIKALDAGYLDMDMFKRMDWERKNKQQGGPVDSYEGGGQLHSRRMYNQKDEDKYGYRAGGPMKYYQDGGEVLPLLQKIVRQAAGENFPASYGQSDRRPGVGPAQFLSERTLGPVATLTGENQGYTSRRTTAGRMDRGEVTGIDEWLQQNLELGPLSIGRRTEAHPDELTNVLYKLGLFGKDMYFDFDKKSKSQKRLLKRFKKETSKEQGGPVNQYQEGGKIDYSKTSGLYNRFLAELGAPAMMGMKDISTYRALQDPESRSPEMYDAQSGVGRQFGKDALLTQALLSSIGMEGTSESDSLELVQALSPVGRRLYESQYVDNKRGGGPVKQYQQGGQMQPRRQKEIRNPEVYGPPVPADIDSLLNQIMMRDVNQSINPFSGDTLDFEEDSLRLLGRMKKSHMPTYGRKKMQQGGPVGGQLGEGQPLERRPSPSEQLARLQGMEARPQSFVSSPEFEAAMEYGGAPQASDSLMASAGQDRRIRPVDTYILKDGVMSTGEAEVHEVPKLSTAYLAAFGFETPFSRRQKALIKMKMIEPESLSAQTKGLIGRALLQRLANEDD
jgi:hypothetical protein